MSDVWVDGARLLAARRLVTMDEGALRTELRTWAEKVRPGGVAEDKHERLPKEAHAHTHAHNSKA